MPQRLKPTLKKLAKQAVGPLLGRLGYGVYSLQRSPEANLLGLAARPIRTVIDVGANRGQFARHARRVFPEARLFCFEPVTEPYEALVAWAREQPAGRVETFRLALGAAPSTQVMHVHLDHTPSSSLLATSATSAKLYPVTSRQQEIEVEVAALDQVLRDSAHALADEVLIKLDVQGFEAEVLKGASETVGRATACIVEVCLEQLYEDQPSFEAIVELMRSSGMRYAGNLAQTRREDGAVIYLDAVFRR